MQSIALDGTWSLTFFPEGSRTAEGPAGIRDIGETIEARVPGNVELDLERAFLAPQGFRGRRVELLFHGLDCLAEVWLNGTRVGSADNMLVEHAFEVAEILRPGEENRLAVRLRSPVLAARAFDYPGSASALATNHESLFIRKAPHMWGWDIAPRAVSAGIWRSVELRAWGEAEIEELYFHTTGLDGKGATLGLHWRLAISDPILQGMELRLVGRPASGAGAGFERAEPVRFTAGSCRIEVREARLWWPRGYGDPSTYLVRCELGAAGQVLSAREERIGIRSIELERTDTTTTEGGQFLFRVNGEPIFCKGSNWVPLDAFHSRDAGRYPRGS